MSFFYIKENLKLLAKKRIVLKKISYKNNSIFKIKTSDFNLKPFLNNSLFLKLKAYIFKNKKIQATYFLKKNNLFQGVKHKLFLKTIFLKNLSSLQISFYLKNILLALLSHYNLQLKRIKYLIETGGSEDLIFVLYKSLISSKDLQNIKNFLFLLQKRSILKTKEELFAQKKILLFLLKNDKKIFALKERLFFFKLIVCFLKVGKKINFNNKTFLKNKNLILKRDSEYKKVKSSTNSFLYRKLIGLILKKGKKNKATKIVQDALINTCIKLQINLNLMINRVFNKLKTSLEIKKIRIRRSFHFVPFPVNFKRKIYLVIKWILLSIKKSKNLKTSFSEKLQKEIVSVLLEKNPLSLKNKKYMLFKSLQNKSNLHYRW